MNSLLALAALILWLLLFFLAVQACQKWAKGRNTVKVIHRNHPAIPVKQYKLSDFATDVSPVAKPAKVVLPPKLSAEQPAQRLASLRNVWDT